MNTARIPDIFPERGRYLYMVSVWLHRRRGVGHVVLALLDADGAACAARGKERIDLTHRPELRDGILLADAHVVRLLRVCVHVPSIAMLAEMLLPLSVCISIVLPS